MKRLILDYKVALPLHPEYRTMPMVWYIPPLSPVVDIIKETGHDAENHDNLFGAIDALRIPVEYLANLFTAGDVDAGRPGAEEARRDAVLHARHQPRPGPARRDPRAVGMAGEDMYEMFRLLALAKYDERYVIPTAHAEQAHSLEELATDCAVSEYGGGQKTTSSVRAPACPPRWRSRTSRCSSSARPATTLRRAAATSEAG